MKKQTLSFKLNKETELPQLFIDYITSSGPSDSYVEDLLIDYNIDVSEVDVKAYLKSYGAWDNEELSNYEINIKRLIWIACLDCQENESTYFYMGQ